MITMAERQSATPPAWSGRSRLALLGDVLFGGRGWWARLTQLALLLSALARPAVVRARLERLVALGHIAVVPGLAQLLVASRDQMFLGAVEETRLFYASQGIPWTFHNLRRFLSGPATMLDPLGLFSPADAIIEHLLQTFHRHPVYDLVLLRAHEGGVEEAARQAQQVARGEHPHQRALASLIEDGAYHARLPREIAAFQADPYLEARLTPTGLVPDAALMLGMDQFKDLAGLTRYAARLRVGAWDAAAAWLCVGWNQVLGGLIWLGPRRVRTEACDPELAARHGLGWGGRG